MGFGLLLIGASLFGGEHDHDTAHEGHEGHAGHGNALHDSGGILSALVSLRFWTWTLGAFGTTGALLTWLGMSPPIHLGVATAVGIAAGGTASVLFRFARRSAFGGSTDLQDLEGVEAEVVLPLHEGGIGKIRVARSGQELELPARALAGATVEVNRRVVIVRVAGEVVEVEALPFGKEES